MYSSSSGRFRLIKRNKRFYVLDAEGCVIYTPSDFIPIRNRNLLHQLCEDLENMSEIKAIIKFETNSRPD